MVFDCAGVSGGKVRRRRSPAEVSASISSSVIPCHRGGGGGRRRRDLKIWAGCRYISSTYKMTGMIRPVVAMGVEIMKRKGKCQIYFPKNLVQSEHGVDYAINCGGLLMFLPLSKCSRA
jgi:hypothetical protein